ncbi:MAG: hypothetical protein ACLQJR_07625 [Stellaceae bacterium]
MTLREPARRKARSLLLRHGYAVGGPVKRAIAEAVHKHEKHDHTGKKLTKLKRGGAAEGAEPRRRADKPRRATGGRVKKAGTKIIIVNGHPQPVPVPRPVPVPVGAAARAPLPAAARLPMPAPMPGGAPMPGVQPMSAARPPMAKRGGRIGPSTGSGPLHMTAGSKNALGRLQKMKAYGAH